jgi:hypothetical protein
MVIITEYRCTLDLVDHQQAAPPPEVWDSGGESAASVLDNGNRSGTAGQLLATTPGWREQHYRVRSLTAATWRRPWRAVPLR